MEIPCAIYSVYLTVIAAITLIAILFRYCTVLNTTRAIKVIGFTMTSFPKGIFTKPANRTNTNRSLVF